MAIILAAMGRVVWCQSGDYAPWSWDIWSSHNSQHFIDPYSISHFEHGLLLCLLMSWLPLSNDRLRSTMWIATAIIEAAWEIAENTPFMIERYRTATISLDYFGDSIINSIGDLTMCMLGAYTAIAIGIADVSTKFWARWKVIGIAIVLELISLWWIRDNLLLNIVMLIHPINSIRDWQSRLK
jgi:hypothetical protein